MLTRFFLSRRWRAWLFLTVQVFALALAHSPSQGAQRLGELTFGTAPAMTLDGPHLGRAKFRPATINEGIRSSTYLSAVGGVAFGGIAVPGEGLRVTSLTYNAGGPAGRRLEVFLQLPSGQQQKVGTNIFDWQLIPIARYADGEALACFTQFGNLRDPQQEQTLLSQGAKILNYHSAFVNTLLGLRLLQADILIRYLDSVNLITEDGQTILGGGEPAVDTIANRNRMSSFRSFREPLSGGPFQSYLICDYGQEVTYRLANGKLELTGRPWWYCWREKVTGADRAKIQDAANRSASEQMNRDRRTLQGMSQAERQERFNRLWDDYVSQHLLQAMPDYSRKLSDKIIALDGVNPQVYQALLATMRYAAFFRHVKKERPQAWDNFMASIRDFYSSPSPRTPTIMNVPLKYRTQ